MAWVMEVLLGRATMYRVPDRAAGDQREVMRRHDVQGAATEIADRGVGHTPEPNGPEAAIE